MKKVLQVVDSLRLGGLETVAVNYLKYMDKTKFEFTYLVYGEEIGELEQEVSEMGAEIIRISNPERNYYVFYNSLRKIIKETGPYDIIHSHPLFNSGFVVRAAYMERIPKRVVQAHSHQKNKTLSLPKKIYQRIMCKWIQLYATDYLAVSKAAGQFLYGEEFFQTKGQIINNGIDVSSYRFNPSVRKSFREKNSVANNIILGHVGSLSKVKNQEFLIQLMPKLLEIDSRFLLFLIGDGEDIEKLKRLSKKLGVSGKVKFLGQRRDISNVLQCVDIFLFPSLYEGLGMALIEAQSAAIPCVVSNNIPSEAIINSNVQIVSLDSTSDWIQAILKFRYCKRLDQPILVAEKGFDVKTMVKQLNSIYKY